MPSQQLRSKFVIKKEKVRILVASLVSAALICSSDANSKPIYAVTDASKNTTPKGSAAKSPVRALGVRTLSLKEMEIGTVLIHPDGTVINFPGKPEIHVGKKGAFEIAYVENDLVISGRTPGSKANLFIYLGGRRYTLKIQFNGTGGDQIVSVRDPLDLSIDAEAFHD